MKMTFNIATFVIVLLLPFALSSQTRKAIPAGRYEALSGIKVSHSNKTESTLATNGSNTIWQEVQKALPAEKNEFNYLKNYSQELNLNSLIPNKGFKESRKAEQGFDLLITEDFKKDKGILKYLKAKGVIVVISKTSIKEMMNNVSPYELIVFQSQNFENYYLLKSK
jgi:hypothetical protein